MITGGPSPIRTCPPCRRAPTRNPPGQDHHQTPTISDVTSPRHAHPTQRVTRTRPPPTTTRPRLPPPHRQRRHPPRRPPHRHTHPRPQQHPLPHTPARTQTTPKTTTG